MLCPSHDAHIFSASLRALELLENVCYDKYGLSLVVTALLSLKIIFLPNIYLSCLQNVYIPMWYVYSTPAKYFISNLMGLF